MTKNLEIRSIILIRNLSALFNEKDFSDKISLV